MDPEQLSISISFFELKESYNFAICDTGIFEDRIIEQVGKTFNSLPAELVSPIVISLVSSFENLIDREIDPQYEILREKARHAERDNLRAEPLLGGLVFDLLSILIRNDLRNTIFEFYQQFNHLPMRGQVFSIYSFVNTMKELLLEGTKEWCTFNPEDKRLGHADPVLAVKRALHRIAEAPVEFDYLLKSVSYSARESFGPDKKGKLSCNFILCYSEDSL